MHINIPAFIKYLEDYTDLFCPVASDIDPISHKDFLKMALEAYNEQYIPEEKCVYVVYAAEIDDDEFAVDLYLIADTIEKAEELAQKDEDDGLIHSGWTIQRTKLEA